MCQGGRTWPCLGQGPARCWGRLRGGMVPSRGAPGEGRCLAGGSGAREVVRAEGVEPSRALRPYGFSYRLRLSPPRCSAGLRSGLSLHRSPARPGGRCCPSSLYTFPVGSGFRPGLARDCHLTGFPEFGQFCTAGFPAGTQVVRSSPLRLPFRHARRTIVSIAAANGRAKRFSARRARYASS